METESIKEMNLLMEKLNIKIAKSFHISHQTINIMGQKKRKALSSEKATWTTTEHIWMRKETS